MNEIDNNSRAAEGLNKALQDMQEKSKTLEESLKSLTAGGFGALSKAVEDSRRTPQRREAGEIAAQDVSKFLRQELASGLAAAFSARTDNAGTSVVIHNNTPAQVSVGETTDEFDRKSLEITIDQMVANSLARGRETGGVLRALFGIVPSLLGR